MINCVFFSVFVVVVLKTKKTNKKKTVTTNRLSKGPSYCFSVNITIKSYLPFTGIFLNGSGEFTIVDEARRRNEQFRERNEYNIKWKNIFKKPSFLWHI